MTSEMKNELGELNRTTQKLKFLRESQLDLEKYDNLIKRSDKDKINMLISLIIDDESFVEKKPTIPEYLGKKDKFLRELKNSILDIRKELITSDSNALSFIYLYLIYDENSNIKSVATKLKDVIKGLKEVITEETRKENREEIIKIAEKNQTGISIKNVIKSSLIHVNDEYFFFDSSSELLIPIKEFKTYASQTFDLIPELACIYQILFGKKKKKREWKRSKNAIIF